MSLKYEDGEEIFSEDEVKRIEECGKKESLVKRLLDLFSDNIRVDNANNQKIKYLEAELKKQRKRSENLENELLDEKEMLAKEILKYNKKCKELIKREKALQDLEDRIKIPVFKQGQDQNQEQEQDQQQVQPPVQQKEEGNFLDDAADKSKKTNIKESIKKQDRMQTFKYTEISTYKKFLDGGETEQFLAKLEYDLGIYLFQDEFDYRLISKPLVSYILTRRKDTMAKMAFQAIESNVQILKRENIIDLLNEYYPLKHDSLQKEELKQIAQKVKNNGEGLLLLANTAAFYKQRGILANATLEEFKKLVLQDLQYNIKNRVIRFLENSFLIGTLKEDKDNILNQLRIFANVTTKDSELYNIGRSDRPRNTPNNRDNKGDGTKNHARRYKLPKDKAEKEIIIKKKEQL